MIENIRLSFKGIWSHKMRSALTMLGIIIGISSIIAIVSIIQSVSEALKNDLLGEGDNTITIGVFKKDDMWGAAHNAYYQGIIEGVSDIPEESVEMVNTVEGVIKSSPFYNMNDIAVTYNAQTTSCSVFGIEKDYFTLTNYHLKKGRLLTQEDYDKGNNVIVIDTMTSDALFGSEQCLGRTISINSELFVVVGLVEVPRDYDKINSIMDYYSVMQTNAFEVFVPSTSWSQIMCYGDAQNLLVEVENLDDTVEISTRVANILNEKIGNEDYKYSSASLMSDMQELEMLTSAISLLLIGIAGISLVVGGIGVMNIMLVSVTERTREIGLKKALGATKGQIRSQFLTEAAVLTGLGGIIGVLLGIGLALMLGVLFNQEIIVSATAIVVSVVFSMGVGLVFGIMPSIKASKLDPIEALRYE